MWVWTNRCNDHRSQPERGNAEPFCAHRYSTLVIRHVMRSDNTGGARKNAFHRVRNVSCWCLCTKTRTDRIKGLIFHPGNAALSESSFVYCAPSLLGISLRTFYRQIINVVISFPPSSLWSQNTAFHLSHAIKPGGQTSHLSEFLQEPRLPFWPHAP